MFSYPTAPSAEQSATCNQGTLTLLFKSKLKTHLFTLSFGSAECGPISHYRHIHPLSALASFCRLGIRLADSHVHRAPSNRRAISVLSVLL